MKKALSALLVLTSLNVFATATKNLDADGTIRIATRSELKTIDFDKVERCIVEVGTRYSESAEGKKYFSYYQLVGLHAIPETTDLAKATISYTRTDTIEKAIRMAEAEADHELIKADCAGNVVVQVDRVAKSLR